MSLAEGACTASELQPKPELERIKDRLQNLMNQTGDMRYRLRSKVDQLTVQDDAKDNESTPEPEHTTLCSQLTAMEDVLERHIRGIERELERLDGVI